MNILVNGIGNIGTTLLNLLVDHKELLGIKNLYAKKRTLNTWNIADLKILEQRGVIICAHHETQQPFAQAFSSFAIYEDIQDTLDYIFETSANKVGNANKSHYTELANLKGVSAQGSEKGFGIPFMSGINEDKIREQKFVQVVSCNTHASLSVLSTFSGNRLENLKEADFVVVRRSEDLENHQRLVSASVVARHLDPTIGTHHAIDALDLLKTIGLTPTITSSDVTTPTQLLHTFRFNLTLKQVITPEQVENLLQQNPTVAITDKFDSNKVFEFGRKYSRYGRLYAQMIVVKNNLLIHNNKIAGWAFIPQEGNTILSTLHAYLLQTGHSDAEKAMEQLKSKLILKYI